MKLSPNDLDQEPLSVPGSLRAEWLGDSPVLPLDAPAPAHALFQLSLTSCVLSQVAGERYVYKFVCDPDALFSMAFPDNQRPFLKAESECHLSEEDTLPLTHFEDNPAYLLDVDRCSGLPYTEGFAY